MKKAPFESYLKRQGERVNKALHKWVPKENIKPSIIHKAMRYSLNAGGKRLRPILVMAAAEACGGTSRQVLPTACAMELIHTYSLVHDDLPAMDNDDLRRGMPTNHRVFGEDIAILAGDALLTYAFQLITKNAEIKGIRPSAIVDVVRIISTGAGTKGMIGGQVADIQSDGGRWLKEKIDRFSTPHQLLHFIHAHKTSALIEVSLQAGARLAEASHLQIRALLDYGRNIGLAFQIQDDILDRIGDKKKLGKKGSDKANKKLTFPALYGLEESQGMLQDHINNALLALNPFPEKKGRVLRELALFLLHRDH